MASRTNAFPAFVPSTPETPPSDGFKPANVISSAEVNGAIYMNYNFINSFINALIANGDLTDSKQYIYNATDLSTLIATDLTSWILNTIQTYSVKEMNFREDDTKYTRIAYNGILTSRTEDNVTYRDVVLPKCIEFRVAESSGTFKVKTHLDYSYLQFNEGNDYSKLNYNELMIQNSEDYSKLSHSTLTFYYSGHTSNYGYSDIYLEDDDGHANYNTTNLSLYSSNIVYNSLNYSTLQFNNDGTYFSLIYSKNNPTMNCKLSNNNSVEIGILPEIMKTNVYSGFGTLNNIYTKTFTATSTSDASTLDTNIKNFINQSGMTIHGMTIDYKDSNDVMRSLEVNVVKVSETSFGFCYILPSSIVLGSIQWAFQTTMSAIYSNFANNGTMTVKVICN